MQIVEALRCLGANLGSIERWQEHGGQNGDDRDDDQELDQGERNFRRAVFPPQRSTHSRSSQDSYRLPLSA